MEPSPVLRNDGDADSSAVADEDRHSVAAGDLSDDHHPTTPDLVKSPNADFDVQVHDDNGSVKGEEQGTLVQNMSPGKTDPEDTQTVPKVLGRRHRQGRLVLRRAAVENKDINLTTLPGGHYETTIVRRAVEKTEGDTSLGMKLNVMGGKVIVQSLTTLADGRASPAQLSGWIQRGDVLLQINKTPLVNLPIDRLMKALDPLSTPDEATGKFAQTIYLRLARGQGLSLLEHSERQKQAMDSSGHAVNTNQPLPPMDPALDVFSLFPISDTYPMTSAHHLQSPQSLSAPPVAPSTPAPSPDVEATTVAVSLAKGSISLEEMIAERLAEERLYDRRQVISEFFSRRAALRLPYDPTTQEEDDGTSNNSASLEDLSPAEIVDLGTQALRGAKALSAIMERVDQGSDRRSFHSLTTTLSLYSRASTRRRYVLDGRVMPVNFDKVKEGTVTEEDENGPDEENDNSSVGSVASSDAGENLDGDELLLQLAATDEIWRKQVLDFLEHAINQGVEDTSDESTQTNDNIDMSNELGSFLFGTDMHEVLKRQRRSHALPPPEITSLLFDLTTKIASTVPDRIKSESEPITVPSSLVPFIGMKRPSDDSNIMLANRFLLDQVLPLWLKSFRPLPLDQRRILWPPERSQNVESTAGSTLSGDDNLTLDSMATKTTSGGSRTHKNLREQIEDNELDPESRAETRFLTTYYFTQSLLPSLLHRNGTPDEHETKAADLEEILSFVSQYGAYLKLHTCLAYASALKQPKLIDALLEVARFDPRHREVMKQTAKASALIIYDSTMLSTVMFRLRDIRMAKTIERQRATIDLCYRAYPDLRPWQVREQCIATSPPIKVGSDSDMSDLYYTYLSLLMHPTDGHDGARHDLALVAEYCLLSVEPTADGSSERLSNFLQVASKTSSNHLAYVRDLPFLLQLSMKISEFNLALDLTAEILDTNTNLNSEDSLRVLIEYVRSIGKKSVDNFLSDQAKGSRFLKRVVRLYNRLSLLSTESAKLAIAVPIEFVALMDHAKMVSSASEESVVDLISFFAVEALPESVLQALVRWCPPDYHDTRLYAVYQTILKEGARKNAGTEMSASLYRVHQAHSLFQQNMEAKQTIIGSEHNLLEEATVVGKKRETLWTKLSHGTLVLDK